MYILAWCCVSMLLGVWSWPYWMIDEYPLLFGGILFCFLSMWQGHRFFVYAMFFVLGNIVLARLPEPQSYEGPIIADVQGRVCGATLVYSNKGRILLRFFGSSPREGERIAARIVPSAVPKSLPGEESLDLCQKRARASYARVQKWFSFGDHEPKFVDSSYQFVHHGGLLWSLMSGDRRFIAPDTIQILRNTGTAHFLAISGMHIGLVSALMYGVIRVLCIPFLWWNWTTLFRFLPCVGAVCAAFFYADHVGWPTSAQRSVCMVVLGMLAIFWGRRVHVWTILVLTACVIVYLEPSQLDSLSFRLSFSAVAGIVWFAPRVTRLIPLDASPIFHRMGGSLAVSLGASLGTFPWVCFYFQEFPWVGVCANILVGPLLGGVAVVCALFARLIGDGVCAHLALAVGDAAIEISHVVLSWLSSPPWKIAFDQWDVLIVATIFLFRRKDLLRIVLVIFVVFVPRCSPIETRITFLAIGQGDSTLIEWSDGRVWLIDGGPPSRQLLRMLKRKKINRLEHIFLSHPHLDHFGGYTHVIGEIGIDSLWTVRPPKGEPEYQKLFSKAIGNGIVIRYPDEKSPSPIRFLHPLNGWKSSSKSHVNEESLVFDMNIEGAKLLFTGDIGTETEEFLVDGGRLLDEYDVVKVAHHGSRFSSGASFVDALHVEHAVILCGSENRFGHPHDSTLFRWRRSHVWRTDQDGVIFFQPSSRRLWIE